MSWYSGKMGVAWCGLWFVVTIIPYPRYFYNFATTDKELYLGEPSHVITVSLLVQLGVVAINLPTSLQVSLHRQIKFELT